MTQTSDARSAIVSNEVFLGGQYIEVGVRNIGSYGTSGSIPNTFYGNPANSRLGLTSDADGFGAGSDLRLDYFLPGGPSEGFAWGFTINGTAVGENYANTALGTSNIDSIVNTDLSVLADGYLSAKTSYYVTRSGSNILAVESVIYFYEDWSYFWTEVTATNVSGQSLTDVRFVRAFDPDNDQYYSGGNYDTDNEIIAVYNTDGYSAVQAKSIGAPYIAAAGGPAVILFYTSDALAKTSIGSSDFGVEDAYNPSIHDNLADNNTRQWTEDVGISISKQISSLGDGEAFTFKYLTSLGSFSVSDILLALSTVDFSVNTFREDIANDGTIATTITVTLDSIASFDGNDNDVLVKDTHYTITNVPVGMAAVVTRTGPKTVTITLEEDTDPNTSVGGHGNANDVSNIVFSFTDAAFTNNAAASSIPGATNKKLYIDYLPSTNAAPTGLGDLTLPVILEDSNPSGVAISAMDGLNFTDTDGAGTFGGVVVVGNAATDSQGVWQYSTNGGTNWSAIGAVSMTSGLSLSSATLLRFLPAKDYNGVPPGLTVHALDSAAGIYSSTGPVVLDATVKGGITAIAELANTITITGVTAVNDAPTFTKGSNQTVGENTGAQTVANWATAISAGAANESGQTFSFTVTNNNNSLFAVQPAIAANGTLSYTLAEGVTGTATITVVLNDNGGTSNGGVSASTSQTFTISVGAAPVVSNLNLDAASGDVNAVLKIDAGATVSIVDSDSANFNGGSLVITKASGSKSGLFTLDGTIAKSGGDGSLSNGENITVNGTTIGTVASNGKDATNLQINFNASATPAAVATLIQQLSYQSGDAGTVLLQIVITDNVGASSLPANVLLAFVGASEAVEGATVIAGQVGALGNGAAALVERKVISSGGQNDNLVDGPSPTLIDVQIANAPGETVYAQFTNGLSGFVGSSSNLLSSNELIDMSRWSQILQNDDAGRAHQSFVMDTQSTTQVLNQFGTDNGIRFLYAGDFEVSGGTGQPMVFSISNTATEGITDVINISRPGTDQIVLDLDGFTGLAITGRGVDVMGSSENNYVITDGAGTFELGNGRDVIVLNDMNAIIDGGQDLDVARVYGNSFSVQVTENGGILYVTNGLGTTTITNVEIVVLDNGYYKKDLSSGAWQWVDNIAKELDAVALIGVQGTEVFL